MNTGLTRPTEHADDGPIGHRPHEDALGLLIGALLVSAGVGMYGHTGLLTGGTAGFAFLIHYAFRVPFGAAYLVVNAPFCYLSFRWMPRPFRVKTLLAVLLVAAFSTLQPHLVHYDRLDRLYAAVAGGLTMGTGFVVLFRHQASLGGVNVVALYLQERHGIRAGCLQMIVDVSVVVAALFVVSPAIVGLSVIGAVALNLVVALNHRPGRYVGI